MLNSNMTPGGVLAAPSPKTAAAGGAAATALSSTAAGRAATERPGPQEGGQALRCPRCDSSNTKFCYYNNYSLSQPRHFCKACKRYWTRGGTLRNVPVGGGCRKNKRLKRAPTAASSSSSASSTDASMPSLPFLPNPSAAARTTPSASSDLGLLLYGLANPASDVSIPMPCNPYDLHQHLGALGQCFPSSTGEDYLPGLIKTTHLAQTAPSATATSAPSPLHESSLFGSAAANFLASTLKQQRQAQQHKPLFHNPDLQSYTGLHGPASGGDMAPLLRDIKLEGDSNMGMMDTSGRNVWEWQLPPSDQQALETTASDSSLYWNMGAAAFGGSVWPDAASYGPSIAPLI